MLAMSGRGNLDILAGLRFRSEFGINNVFELATSREQVITDKHKISTRHRGKQLFGAEVTHGTLASWIRNGAEVRSTQLSEEFDFETYRNRYGEHCLPLFVIDPKDRLQMFTVENNLSPEPGWTIVSLIRPDEDEKTP